MKLFNFILHEVFRLLLSLPFGVFPAPPPWSFILCAARNCLSRIATEYASATSPQSPAPPLYTVHECRSSGIVNSLCCLATRPATRKLKVEAATTSSGINLINPSFRLIPGTTLVLLIGICGAVSSINMRT